MILPLPCLPTYLANSYLQMAEPNEAGIFQRNQELGLTVTVTFATPMSGT